jgi:hypothetical protein
VPEVAGLLKQSQDSNEFATQKEIGIKINSGEAEEDNGWYLFKTLVA